MSHQVSLLCSGKPCSVEDVEAVEALLLLAEWAPYGATSPATSTTTTGQSNIDRS
jgi:hypothetical protein